MINDAYDLILPATKGQDLATKGQAMHYFFQSAMLRQRHELLESYTPGWAAALVIAILFCANSSIAQLDEAEALTNRAVELYKAGRHLEAIPLAERALSIREKVLGPDHPDVATALNNLAGLYNQQGRYVEALMHRTIAQSVANKSIACGRGPA